MSWTRALVTGASSGIGACIARRLAESGTDLVLVARSEKELNRRAEALSSGYGVDAEPLVADLIDQADLGRVAGRLGDDDRPVDLLVNNAGSGSIGAVVDLPAEREQDLLRLDGLAVLHLTRSAAQAMRRRGGGSILNMSSLSAYAPVPYFATYTATKAFVLHFSLAVREELRGSGVSVTTVCPAGVNTRFAEKAGVLRPPLRWLWAEPDDTARRALAGAASGRAVVLPGPTVPLAAAGARLLPPALFARGAATIARRLLGDLVRDAAQRNERHGQESASVDELQHDESAHA